ncbi:neuronal acetylcholine receptor subunit alpha-7-like [Dendronephthya gigantea]|uniref:neuronal acetylcholine receptor subunit alpha-7-like n=1 Tax=Dendronephthya gigantea TaxID=151771 RepID=UPI00106C58D8|nr:neuronal acetylcholine receptor subunit alpha-7-like [Dendronephthya gigantea]
MTVSFLSALFFLTTIAILLDNYRVGAQAQSLQTDLVKQLMSNYSREVRPWNGNSPTEITLDVALIKLVSVEEKTETLTTNIWIRLYWKDERLSWNKTKFDGLSKITLKHDMVWIPDIGLLNRAEGSDEIGSVETRLRLHDDGNITWLIQTIYRSSCSIDISYFPFDDQTCQLIIGSRTYNKKALKIVPKNRHADIKQYTVHGEWTLLGTSALQKSVEYSYSDEEYSTVRFYFYLRRQTLYYMMNFIVPCVLIAVLTVPVLLLPPESQERQSYGVTVLLSFTILIMMLQEKVPPTSKVYPMIGVYYACTIVQVSLAMGMSTVMLCFYHKRPCTTPIPKWVKVIVLKWCAKLVRMEDSVEKVKQKLYGTSWKQVAIRKSRTEETCGMKGITEHVFNKQEESVRQEEWRIAAYIVNRFFAWVYLFTIVLTFFVVFFKAPRTKEGTL